MNILLVVLLAVANFGLMPPLPSSSRAALRPTTLAWLPVPGTNVLYRVYGTTNADPYWLDCVPPRGEKLLWSGTTTNATLGTGTNWTGWHIAVTATASTVVTTNIVESPTSNEVIIALLTVNRVTVVQAQSSASLSGPWSNGPVVFVGTNVVGNQYWRLNIMTTNQ